MQVKIQNSDQNPIERVFVFHETPNILVFRVESNSRPSLVKANAFHTQDAAYVEFILPWKSKIPHFDLNRGYFDVYFVNAALEEHYKIHGMQSLVWDNSEKTIDIVFFNVKGSNTLDAAIRACGGKFLSILLHDNHAATVTASAQNMKDFLEKLKQTEVGKNSNLGFSNFL